jgi:hypothetical protein
VKLEKEKTLDISLGFSWEMKEHEVLKFDESGIHELEERERAAAAAVAISRWCARSNLCRDDIHGVFRRVGIIECDTVSSSQRSSIHDKAVVVAEALEY